MHISRFFPGISLVFFSFLSSCGGTDDAKVIEQQLKHPDDYSERIDHIFDYIQKSGFDIKFEKCTSIYILQPNLCNVCTKKTLKSLIDSTKSKTEPIAFILGGKNPEIESFIKKTVIRAGVYIDSSGLLENYNLSFLKNVKINTCKNKVVRWSFL